LLALSFSLVACGGDDDDDDFDPTDIAGINADNADWIVNLMAIVQNEKSREYMVMVNYTGDNTTLQPTDMVTLEIDGTPLSWMSAMPGYYHTQTLFVPGQTYSMKFKFNSTEKANTNFTIPWVCDGTFPSTFNPAQASEMSWTLSNNNQYQVAGVNASKYVSSTENYFDEYIKSISTSARSFSIPANSVQNFGAGTSYTMFVDEINFKNVNRIAFLGWESDMTVYQAQKKELTPEWCRDRARKLIAVIGR
jgi:hypothetical protein